MRFVWAVSWLVLGGWCWAQVDFVETQPFGELNTESMAWGDCNGDGYLDMAVGNWGDQMNTLYLNHGDGTFSGSHCLGAGWTIAACWADSDADGNLDVLIGNDRNQTNPLFMGQGDGSFTLTTPFGLESSSSVAWADVDRDGDLDLAVGNGFFDDEPNSLFLRREDGGYDHMACFGAGKTRCVAWGDADGDGDPDLAVGNDGQNGLAINDGTGHFTWQDAFGDLTTSSVAWGDADGDGDLDLAVGNGFWDSAQNMLYINQGDSVFEAHESFGTGTTLSLAWADVDHDGDLDLAVGNYSGQPNLLCINDGQGSFFMHTEFGQGYTESVAWGDADGDGDLDLAVGNNGHNALFINQGSPHEAVAVRLVGHFHDQGPGCSVRSAVGARVDVFRAGGTWSRAEFLGMREIEANGGCCGQDSLEAEFGVPGCQVVDVRVSWPGSHGSRRVEVWPQIPTNQTVELHEGTGTPVSPCLMTSWDCWPHESTVLTFVDCQVLASR